MEPANGNEREGDKTQDSTLYVESTSTVLDYVHKQVESVSYEINRIIDAKKNEVSLKFVFSLPFISPLL